MACNAVGLCLPWPQVYLPSVPAGARVNITVKATLQSPFLDNANDLALLPQSFAVAVHGVFDGFIDDPANPAQARHRAAPVPAASRPPAPTPPSPSPPPPKGKPKPPAPLRRPPPPKKQPSQAPKKKKPTTAARHTQHA